MKRSLKATAVVCVLMVLWFMVGCGPQKKVETEPQVTPVPVPHEPTIEELRKPVAVDPAIYKAEAVIKEYGRLSKKHISFEKFQQVTGGREGAAIDPDWFYDSYKMNTNENDYWITIFFGSAQRAIEHDARIKQAMTDLPQKSIVVELTVPQGRTYLLSDANADGILDFAKDTAKKDVTKVDIELLDKMQEKYTWVLGLIKKHYSKIKK